MNIVYLRGAHGPDAARQAPVLGLEDHGVALTACEGTAGVEVLAGALSDAPSPDLVLADDWQTAVAAAELALAPVALWSASAAPDGTAAAASIQAAGIAIITADPDVASAWRRAGAAVHTPAPDPRDFHPGYEDPTEALGTTPRIVVVGDDNRVADDVATAMAACRHAARRGQPLSLVRLMATDPPVDTATPPFLVEYHNAPSAPRRGALFRQADVFVSCARGAGPWSLAPIEAMACGLPCILSDTVAHRHLAAHRAALLGAPGNADRFADLILAVTRTPPVRAALHERGPRAASDWRAANPSAALAASLRTMQQDPPLAFSRKHGV